MNTAYISAYRSGPAEPRPRTAGFYPIDRNIRWAKVCVGSIPLFARAVEVLVRPLQLGRRLELHSADISAVNFLFTRVTAKSGDGLILAIGAGFP